MNISRQVIRIQNKNYKTEQKKKIDSNIFHAGNQKWKDVFKKRMVPTKHIRIPVNIHPFSRFIHWF